MFIPELNSTNDYLREHPELEDDGRLLCLRTDYQTAGHGQQGNGWESERGKNLLCSIRWRNTGINATEAFRINQLVSLSVLSVLHSPFSLLPSIKWPNDIYIGDKKLAGILVENTFCGGAVSESIIGIGLNLNQTTFTSAPNPTSLRLETGQTWEPEHVMQQIVTAFRTMATRAPEELMGEYMSHLYRREGFYPYCEREVSAAPSDPLFEPVAHNFMARIVEVTPQGELVLERQDGTKKTYHFKQIQYILPCKQ